MNKDFRIWHEIKLFRQRLFIDTEVLTVLHILLYCAFTIVLSFEPNEEMELRLGYAFASSFAALISKYIGTVIIRHAYHTNRQDLF